MELCWDPFCNWDSFKSRFRDQFQPVNYERILVRELNGRFQGPDESLSFFLRVIIRPSKSPWSSRGFIVPKHDGSWRFVVDYRALNKIMVRDNYPVPNIEEILAHLGEAEYFSTYDLYKGFHQMMMHEDDIEKTAFICHHGLFEFVR